jgi:hypothetical protein
MGRRMKRMSQAADGTPILGAPIGTLSCRFCPFYMIDMFVPSADARA